MDKFHLIKVFVAVVDTNGFAGAARKLNISPPAVTRAINELETQLGLQLLTRTTRTVRVTELGERYVQDCRKIIEEMLEADESVSGMHSSPKGRLTITAPALFGGAFITPIVTEYLH
jgi:DNA-binding transcriptional LysR family regulator